MTRKPIHLFVLPLLTLLLVAWMAFAQAALAAGTHTVQYGDTIGSIANNYGVSSNALAQANNIVNPNLIYIGQVLSIPGGNGGGGGTGGGGNGAVHYVAAGEGLASIAQRYGVSTWDIQNANGIGNPNLIYVGQRLTIPAGGSYAPAPSPAPNYGYKQIIVDLSDQRTYIYQGGAHINTFVNSTGQPGSETWTGTYYIQNKIPNAYAATWDLQMPYWMGFYYAGALQNGFHALPILSNGQVLWDGYLGTPVSYGCVIHSYWDSATLYEWATVGTEVVVRY